MKSREIATIRITNVTPIHTNVIAISFITEGGDVYSWYTTAWRDGKSKLGNALRDDVYKVSFTPTTDDLNRKVAKNLRIVK
jgi:hypothetical protein